ncbi:hypothetical protein PIB30_059395 [Stylosanthes scabra]|uniref:Uncharacterized protein n=1 Tax=Stylosanthes scabra TaxID=79078 RepID=A0ABU6UJA7_9FABA|nr:hypothetical protein [Stylosanthes scabra]
MVFSLATISSFYGSLPDSIREQSGSVSEYYDDFMAYAESIQQTTDLEFKVKIQQEQETTNQHQEPEIDDVDAATFQIATEITDSVTIQNTSPEITTSTKAQLDLKEKNRSQSQNQEDEESDGRSIYHGYDVRSMTVVLQRPPLEPSDLELLAVGDGAFDEKSNYYGLNAWSTLSTLVAVNRPPPKPPNFTEDDSGKLRSLAHEIGCTIPGIGDEGLAASSGAEDGAIAKGNVVDAKAEPFSHLGDNDAADLNCGGCAKDTDDGTRPAASVNIGESTTSARSAEVDAIASMTDGGLRAVFPWDREEATRMWVLDEPEIPKVTMVVAEKMVVANLLRARARVVQRPPPKPPHLSPVMVVLGKAAATRKDGSEVPSFCGFKNGEKRGRGFLEAAAGVSGFSQSVGDRRALGLAVVELTAIHGGEKHGNLFEEESLLF